MYITGVAYRRGPGRVMMINVAIVEDEAEHSETLRKYLNRYADEQHESFSVSVFDNAVTFLENTRRRTTSFSWM